MNRRLMGGAASILLALLGTGVLVAYVRSAEDRALAGKELVQVILVDGDRPIPAGTEADRIPLRVTDVPVETVVPNVVENALDIVDMVTAVELIPGEQLIWSRLTDAEEYAEEQERLVGPTDLPPGYMEISIPVPADRALGGRIEVGETIALIGIFEGASDPTVIDPNDSIEGPITNEDTLAYVEPPPGQSTHILADGVLVTGIQVDELPIEVNLPIETDENGDPIETEVEEPTVTQAPGGIFLLSLALRAYDVERVIFAQEYGSMWIARDPMGADHNGSQIQTLETIYERIELPLTLPDDFPGIGETIPTSATALSTDTAGSDLGAADEGETEPGEVQGGPVQVGDGAGQ